MTSLRDRIAAALRDHGMPHLAQKMPDDEYDCCADAVLPVLPPPADRAAVLLWAADKLDAMLAQVFADWPTEPKDSPGVRSWQEAVAELRRLAAEAQQPEAEPHPPHDSWLVEWSADGDEWAVAYPTHDHSKALERLARGRQETPEWQWRLVRETTTYTVEQPAAADT